MPLKERQEKINQALEQTSPITKVLISLLKIAFIFPLFWLIADYKGAISIVGLFVIIIFYPLILRPIELNIAAKEMKRLDSNESSQ